MRLVAVQQRAGLRDVGDIGCHANNRVHQARLGVHGDVGLYAEQPGAALLRLMHLGVARLALVLRRAWARR